MKKLCFVAMSALIATGCGDATSSSQTADTTPVSSSPGDLADVDSTTESDANTDSADKPEENADGDKQSPGDKIAGIIDSFDGAMKEFTTWYESASEEEKSREAVMARLPDRDEYGQKILAAVNEAPNDPAAIDALGWLVENTRGEASKSAMETLFKNHRDHEIMAKVAPMLAFETGEVSEKRLRTLVETATNERVKGTATLALASYLTNVPRMKDMVESNPGTAQYYAEHLEYLKAFEVDKKEVEDLYQTVLDKYASISGRRGTLGESAEAALFEMRNLQVGMQVPDIEGADLDGVDFKLSDYRGKVVLLDFWGNW